MGWRAGTGTRAEGGLCVKKRGMDSCSGTLNYPEVTWTWILTTRRFGLGGLPPHGEGIHRRGGPG